MDEGAPGEQAAAQPHTEIPEGTTGEGDSHGRVEMALAGCPAALQEEWVRIGLMLSLREAAMWVDSRCLGILGHSELGALMPDCFRGCLPASQRSGNLLSGFLPASPLPSQLAHQLQALCRVLRGRLVADSAFFTPGLSPPSCWTLPSDRVTF